MMRFLLLTSLMLPSYAAAGDALDCLETTRAHGGFDACLGESRVRSTAPVLVSASGPLDARLQAPVPDEASSSRVVPTPTGWLETEDGTVAAGFFKGLDSGFKAAFGAIVSPAVYGLEASGGRGAASDFFTGLGVLLAIPGWVVASFVGAPLGAVAGVIAEKVSPGSTKDWFTF